MLIIAGAIGTGFFGFIFVLIGLTSIGVGVFRPIIREWVSKKIE